MKREIWKDLFVTLTLYNTYDSQPPNPAANTNDIGIVTSIGWSVLTLVASERVRRACDSMTVRCLCAVIGRDCGASLCEH